MKFDEFLMWNKIRVDDTDSSWLKGAQYAFENRESVIDLIKAEKDAVCVVAETYKDEIGRLKEALMKISGGGGVCTDNDDCPICIADKALGRE